MSTTAAKGESFVRMVSLVAYHVRRAYNLAQMGVDLWMALDVAGWLADAPVDEDGDLVGMGVSPAEVNTAAGTIVQFLAFLDGGAATQGEHLDNLLLCLSAESFVE